MMAYKTEKPLSKEERELLVVAIEELKKRGKEIPLDLVDSRIKKSTKYQWPLDENGYFIKYADKKHYQANETLQKFVYSKSPFVGLIGGRGSGKTAAGAQKAMRKIMEGGNGSVINPDMENFKISTWPEFREWIPWNLVVPRHAYRGDSSWTPREPFTLTFRNGATVYCKGLKDPNSARGPNLNWLWYDEAGRDQDGLGWKLATAGVRIGKNPQSWLTTTPKGMEHWIYKFFVKKEIPQDALELFSQLTGYYGEREDTPLLEIFFRSIDDNRDNLSPLFYAQMLATYPPGWMRNQELGGQFVPEGGALGKREWFIGKILGMQPDKIERVVRYWDLAASEKKITGRKSDDPDHTVGTKLCADGDKFVAIHQVGAQVLWHKIKELIVDTAKLDGMLVQIGRAHV
jgi:hypothetical protein